jgi:hypothetical protein
MENIRELDKKLTDEEMKLLEEARKRPIVFDEDCPETTPERAIRFRRVNPSRKVAGK